LIADVELDHPVRTGIDGVDASGKTVLADEVSEALRNRGRDVIRVSIDGFHNPRKIRYRQGRESPQGYYDDSFNYSAIVREVLEPLGPYGNLRFRRAIFDFKADSEVHIDYEEANPRAVLLFDGVFLHRSELHDYWDCSVFVRADFDITVKRAQTRDHCLFETPEEIQRVYSRRYIPGQRIYLDAISPERCATVVWDNNVCDYPTLTYNEQT
jgi:uridine kinase